MSMLGDDLDSAADNLTLASDKLRWLSRLEQKGKLPARLHKKCRTLIKSVDATVKKLVHFGKDDDYLDDPALDAE